MLLLGLPSRLGPPLPTGRQGRTPSVRRIDDQRGAPGANSAASRIQPKIVVEPRRPIRPTVHVAAARRPFSGAIQQADVPVDRFLFEGGSLLHGQELLVGQLLWPLQGRDRTEVPNTLQVRLTPRRPRRCGLGRRRRSPQRPERDQHSHGTYQHRTLMAHLPPPISHACY